MKIQEFVFELPESEVAGARCCMKYMSLQADAWEVKYVATRTGEIEIEFREEAIEALLLCEQLAEAEPPIIATLRPLYYADAEGIAVEIMQKSWGRIVVADQDHIAAKGDVIDVQFALQDSAPEGTGWYKIWAEEDDQGA